MAFGRSNRGVAAELDLSVKAVEKAVTRVVRKLGLNDEPLLDSRLSASLVYLRAQGGARSPCRSATAGITTDDRLADGKPGAKKGRQRRPGRTIRAGHHPAARPVISRSAPRSPRSSTTDRTG